jgi:type I restriction enzyme, S subunit
MIDGLRPYPEMKSTGLPWLPELPTVWETHRAKYSFREVDDRSVQGDEELLSVSHKTGVTPRSQKNVTMFMAESYEGHKVCHPGDVVVNTMWAWMAALGVSPHVGIVSPSYGIYRPRTTSQFEPQYLDYLLRTEAYRAEYLRNSRGVTTSRLRLYPPDFLKIQFIQPPLDEQRLIVRFLNWHGAKTTQLIRAKQKLIKLLAEEREAVTHNALRLESTQSLSLRVVADRVERQINRLDDQVYTPIGLFNRGRGIFHKAPTKGAELGDSTFFWIEEGDLVLSGQFAWEGAIALAGQEDTGCVATHRYPVFRGKPNMVESAYLLSFFKTGLGHLLLDQHSRGAAGRNRPLNARTLMKEKIPIPPLPVQERITSIVHLETRLRLAVTKTAELLREYRTRLITDVVTGKLDVREAAAKLPDEPEDMKMLDAAEDLDGTEDTADEVAADDEPEEAAE